MDRVTLRDAVLQLQAQQSSTSFTFTASEQAVRQYNALLITAKEHYPDRPDIQSLAGYQEGTMGLYAVFAANLTDAVYRLSGALLLRPTGSAGEAFAQIRLPLDAPEDLIMDMRELELAIGLSMGKTILILTGSIAEALLILRHPDSSDRGPGLNKLVSQARSERLFGRDTLRQLDSLVEYRDLIHPRAEARNQTWRNEARIDSAVSALRLLCSELEDTTVRYGS